MSDGRLETYNYYGNIVCGSCNDYLFCNRYNQAEKMNKYRFDKCVNLRYKLERPERMEILPGFTFCLGHWKYTVAEPFWSDGASIPQAVRSLIGDRFAEPYMIAALIHDILYAIQDTERAKADKVLYDVMKLCGVGKIKAWTIYRAVRMFGMSAWEEKTEEMINGAKKHINITDLIEGMPIKQEKTKWQL